MEFKKLLFIIVVFLAGIVASTVASTVTGTLFSNGEINYIELKSIIFKILDDPLFIILTGGGITSLVIPRLTNKIHDRKVNFEIKKELVKKINKSTTRLLEKIKMLSIGVADEEKLSEEFFNWSESCSEIGTTVRVYWSGGKGKCVVEDEWNEYYKHVVMLYSVITNFKKEEGNEKIEKKIISFLETKSDSDIELEYKENIVKKTTEKFFEETDKRDSFKTDPEKYSQALYELVRLFDKRKYYILELVFKNKIKNH